MVQSRKWTALKKQVERYRDHLLPETFSPTGTYRSYDKIQICTRAFILLCHAEIECYLEEWAKEIARVSEDLWMRTGRVSLPMAFLIGSKGERLRPAVTMGNLGKKDSPLLFKEFVEDCFREYYTLLTGNNGVK